MMLILPQKLILNVDQLKSKASGKDTFGIISGSSPGKLSLLMVMSIFMSQINITRNLMQPERRNRLLPMGLPLSIMDV